MRIHLAILGLLISMSDRALAAEVIDGDPYTLFAIMAVYNDTCERVSDKVMAYVAVYGASKGMTTSGEDRARLLMKFGEVNGVLKVVGKETFCRKTQASVQEMERAAR